MSEKPLDKLLKALSPAGVAPRSGRCTLCGVDLTEKDTDHSVCNECWAKTMLHTYVEWEGSCEICGEQIDDVDDAGNRLHK